MFTVTIAITEDAGQVAQPDDIQGLGTIAPFLGGVAVPARIGTRSLRQIDADLELGWSWGGH